MGFLDDLVSRYESNFFDVPEPTATDAVPHDRFDEASWQEVREDVPAIETMITDLSRKHDYVEDFAKDFFNLTVKGDPQVRDRDEMKPSHEPNNAMISEFQKMPEIQHLRSLTANDQYAAAMGFLSMKDKIAQAVERMQQAREQAEEKQAALDELREAQEAAQAALDQAAQDQAALDQLDEDADENARSQAQQQAQDAADAAEIAVNGAAAAQTAAQTASQAAQGAQEAAIQSMRADIRQAAAKAAEEAEEEAQLFSAFGVEDGELKRMSFKERAALAKRLKGNRLAKFAKLIGQFKQLQAAESRRRVKHVADEVVDLELGDDLTRLSTQEMINLATDEMEDDFWLRYVNRQLLVKRLEGTERLGQGPIIVVNDESGSMEAALAVPGVQGTREAWSKAFALAMAEQARKQGRDFHYIGFSSSGQQWTISFDKGKGTLNQVIEMTEHFWDGGTNFEKPLTMALDIVEQAYDATGHPKPDVVFVSDDDYGSMSQEFMHRWNKAKDKMSLKCRGVAMATPGHGAMEAVCDDVIAVTDLTADPRAVGNLFRTI